MLCAFCWVCLNANISDHFLRRVHWKDVASTDRDGYAIACLACACEPTAVQTLYARLRWVDMALLLGAELFRGILQSIAQIIHNRVAPPWSPHDSSHTSTTARQFQTMHPVPVLYQPTLQQFYRFMLEGKPVVIQGMMDDWPCTVNWKDINYLRCVLHALSFRYVFSTSDIIFLDFVTSDYL